MNHRLREVAAAFGAAATDYEHRADIQRHAADRLAERLCALALPERPRVLELGCGSGLLSRHLRRLYPRGRFLFTDASPEMVVVARRTLGRENDGATPRFAVMDGERPAVRPGFELIVANMAWQWFQEPLASLARMATLLSPEGRLLFSTLGEQTFREWRSLCERAGLPCGVLRPPTRSDWERGWPEHCGGGMEEELVVTRHPSPLAFLRDLAAIGANRPTPGHRPVSPGELRRALRSHGEGFPVTHHLLYGLLTPRRSEAPHDAGTPPAPAGGTRR